MNIGKLLGVIIFVVVIFGAAWIFIRASGNLLSGRGDILVLDDFEDLTDANVKDSVDFGSGNSSRVFVFVSSDPVFSGEKALKVEYDSVPGGYMWIARGYGLDVKGAAKWLCAPEKIKWDRYGVLSFYMYGQGTGTQIAVDLRDAQKEYWRYMITDTKKGWTQVKCPLDEFFSRSDWQPEDAVVDSEMSFPLKSFQLEPRTPGKGVFYIDKLQLSAS